MKEGSIVVIVARNLYSGSCMSMNSDLLPIPDLKDAEVLESTRKGGGGW